MLGFNPIAASPIAAAKAFQGYIFEISAGAFNVVGQDANKVIYVLTPQGVFETTGQDLTFVKSLNMLADSGTYSYEGHKLRVVGWFEGTLGEEVWSEKSFNAKTWSDQSTVGETWTENQ